MTLMIHPGLILSLSCSRWHKWRGSATLLEHLHHYPWCAATNKSFKGDLDTGKDWICWKKPQQLLLHRWLCRVPVQPWPSRWWTCLETCKWTRTSCKRWKIIRTLSTTTIVWWIWSQNSQPLLLPRVSKRIQKPALPSTPAIMATSVNSERVRPHHTWVEFFRNLPRLSPFKWQLGHKLLNHQHWKMGWQIGMRRGEGDCGNWNYSDYSLEIFFCPENSASAPVESNAAEHLSAHIPLYSITRSTDIKIECDKLIGY